jgi:hypothetical protein
MKRKSLLLIIWFSFTAIACNLTSNEKPPTLVPQSTLSVSTQATLGYAPPAPGAAQATAVAASSSIDVELFNLLNQVESDRLMMHINALVDVHTRHVNSSTTSLNTGVGAAYTYILGQLQMIQAQTPDNFFVGNEGHQFTAYYNDKQSIQRNAYATIRGTEVGGGVIIIGAHYDSRNDYLDDATSASPGADDNGSGVAAVLELARILSQTPHRSTIIFVFFSAEEVGRQGSQAFVNDYIKARDIPVFAMINIDTIGSWDAPDGTINDQEIRIFAGRSNDDPSRQLARTADLVGTIYDSILRADVQSQIDREGRYGDHQSFTDAGYPAIRFIEALEDTPNRESRDTINGIEPAYLVEATQTILGFVTVLADGPRPPLNMVLRDMDNGMQSLVWEPINGAVSYIVALRLPNSIAYSNYFETSGATSGEWDGFAQYEALAIAAQDADGLIGPFSEEYKIPR